MGVPHAGGVFFLARRVRHLEHRPNALEFGGLGAPSDGEREVGD